MIANAQAEVAIFGGGVAGLWLHNHLKNKGYCSVLLENDALGGGQTHKSQGMIHGGMKYSMLGTVTRDAQTIAAMPERFIAAMQGKGDVDLSKVQILSHAQYLWSQSKLTAKITGFLAQHALQGQVATLAKKSYPKVFQHPAFRGQVYALHEMVIDVASLVESLSAVTAIYKINPWTEQDLEFSSTHKLNAVIVRHGEQAVKLHAQNFIFLAGAGNEQILHAFKEQNVQMQRRPLHMVVVKLAQDIALFGHCFGGARPRITITTHQSQQETFWYLGGALAEEGINRQPAQQKLAAKKELQTLFPWLDWQQAEFRSFMIDRAEAKHPLGLKPESSVMKTFANIVVGWPTKLVLAPKLTDEIFLWLESNKQTAPTYDIAALQNFSKPAIAQPVWETLFCKNVA